MRCTHPAPSTLRLSENNIRPHQPLGPKFRRYLAAVPTQHPPRSNEPQMTYSACSSGALISFIAYIALNRKTGGAVLVLDQVKQPLVATDEEAVIAKEAAEKLRSVALAGVDVRLRAAEKDDVVIPLPARAVAMIVQVLNAMAERKPISLIPHTAELTTQQAADFLNMSRPHLVGRLRKSRSRTGW